MLLGLYTFSDKAIAAGIPHIFCPYNGQAPWSKMRRTHPVTIMSDVVARAITKGWLVPAAPVSPVQGTPVVGTPVESTPVVGTPVESTPVVSTPVRRYEDQTAALEDRRTDALATDVPTTFIRLHKGKIKTVQKAVLLKQTPKSFVVVLDGQQKYLNVNDGWQIEQPAPVSQSAPLPT